MGDDEQGIVLCDLPLTADRKDQIDALDTAFKEGNAFDMLLAIATGYWPIILAATTTDYPYRPNPDSGSSHS